MSKLYDVFDTQALAQEALDFIANLGEFPRTKIIKGVETITTSAWDVGRQRITDNKWYFSRVTDAIRADYPQEVLAAYMLIPHTEEAYSDDWEAIAETT